MDNHDHLEQITDVQVKYVDTLMTLVNVIGVGIGFAKVSGDYTEQMALIVMVEHKVPETDLPPTDVVPREIEGVRVDVQEVGALTTF